MQVATQLVPKKLHGSNFLGNPPLKLYESYFRYIEENASRQEKYTVYLDFGRF